MVTWLKYIQPYKLIMDSIDFVLMKIHYKRTDNTQILRYTCICSSDKIQIDSRFLSAYKELCTAISGSSDICVTSPQADWF